MGTLHKALLLGLSLVLLLPAADPPADVDAALRDRVQSFYQLQVDGKFRQAEQFVAADTKDFYYDSPKSAIRPVKISKIQYAPDFQSATVTLSSRKLLVIPGAAPKDVDVVLTTDWKVDDGKWCWYMDRSKARETPFGRVSPPKVTPKPDAASAEIARLAGRAVSAAAVMDAVHASPTRVQLDPDNPQPQIVTLKNALPGPVTIQSVTDSQALKVTIDKPNLGAGESTQVTITPVKGGADRPAHLVLRASPIGQIIQIDLDYGRPN